MSWGEVFQNPADVGYKLFRKLLPQGVKVQIKKSKISRASYFNNKFHFDEIYKLYKSQKFQFKNKCVMELGCGNQFYTAAMFLNDGAKEVYLIEPNFSKKKEIEIPKIVKQSFPNLVPSIAINSIHIFSDIKVLSESISNKIDFVFSYTVLEHIKDLDRLFYQLKILLNQNGKMFHEIDFTDHTYHVFNGKKMLSILYKYNELTHLSYSTGLYCQLSDESCFMNRKLIPDFEKIFFTNKFKVESLKLVYSDKKYQIHPDLYPKNPSENKLNSILNASVVLSHEI